jgi:hypothetical protein
LPLLPPGPAPAQTRQELLRQLWTARQVLTAGGLGYLGVLAGELDGGPRIVLLGIAAAPLEVPDGVNPASLLAGLLRHHHPDAEIEQFPAAQGDGVGIRRCGELPVPTAAPGGEPLRIDTGISQALVIFAEARLLGTVTGFCFTPDDIDLATVFTATIACRMSVMVTDALARTAVRRRPATVIALPDNGWPARRRAGRRSVASVTAPNGWLGQNSPPHWHKFDTKQRPLATGHGRCGRASHKQARDS